MPTICVNCKNYKIATEEELNNEIKLFDYIQAFGIWDKPEKTQREYILRRPCCIKFGQNYVLGFSYMGDCYKKNTDGNCPDYEEKEK